ncbi:hypothetical protein G9A89_015339 [Geosiphon pyriformis]|nr:hypothetical protein G9A89_015339 [Geosiphon pyriformis]
MSKKKAPKGAFHGPAGGSFSQKKRVMLGNVKHSGNEKDISLNRSELGNSMFFDVNSVSGNEENTNITGINVESLLDSAVNTPKAKCVNTSAIFSLPFGSPNFVMDDDEDTQVEVFVKKSFALDINLSAVERNSTTAKIQLIRKIFSSVNSFGRAITPSKFEGIIQSTFTFKKNMNMATSLARERRIIINTNLKKSGIHSNQAVVIKKILIDTPKKMIVAAVIEFGNIKSIKIQLISMWQKAVVEFTKLSQANLLASRWSFLIRKDFVHVVKAMGDRNIWASRDHFRALLFTLSMETTAHNLGTLLDRTGSKTCIINQSLNTGNRFQCAVVGFESEKNLDSAFHTEPVFGGVQLSWAKLDLCDTPVGFMPLSSLVKSFKGFVFEERHLQLVKLYKKKEVPIFHPVAFSEKSWTQVVSVAFLLSHGFPAGPSSNLFPSSYHNIGDISFLNKCLVSLECSLELLSDQVSTIVRCLNSAELVPLVSFSFVSPPDASASSALDSGLDMVLDDTSILSVLSFSTVGVDVHILSPSSSRILTDKVGGLESKLASLEAFIGSVLACLDGLCSSLVDVVHWHISSGSMVSFVIETKLRPPSGPWIKNKFEGVWIFTSGLDVGYLSAGVTVIMNNSLACHISKIKVVPGHVISVCLLFKDKLLVTVLGLYAGASSGVCFGQVSEVNSLIAKAVNTSNFVVLGGDFNENGSGRSASFRFCLGFGLVNSFAGHQLTLAPMWYNLRGIKKTIDYILVSESLLSAVAEHWVRSVSDFFDMDHSAVTMLVGLNEVLDVQLNSLHRQANRDCWKFKIKNADVSKWDKFKNCVLTRLLLIKDVFANAKVGGNLDTMWAILEKEMVESADKIFSRLWFSKFYCFRNKHSLKFFGLELLVTKILGVSTLDEDKTCAFSDLVRLGKDNGVLFKHLSLFYKEYRKSKMFESRLVEEASVRKAIKKCIESFTFNKEDMIRSILDRSFCKVLLDHLVIDEGLVLEPGEIKFKVNEVMAGWTRKRVIPMMMPNLWAHQYAPLDYVHNDAFSGVMCEISLDELLSVVNDFPNGKATGLSGILNKLWKHSSDVVLGCLLELLNICVIVVLMIPKSYNWNGVLINTWPIVLIETARKILSKILFNRILSTCNKFGVLCGDNFFVLKSTSTQFLVFAVGSVVEDALEKNCEFWLVLQDMHKAYDLVGWHHLEASLKHIKMCSKFISFFRGIHNDRINRVMTDFGLSDGYCVKRHEHLCRYRINTNFVTKTGRIKNSGGMSSFFAASVFSVKVASLSISGQPISIAKKGEAYRYLGIFLSTERLFKLGLDKTHLDVCFFVNVVLRKAITNKQYSYLVSTVLQSIVNYRMQFSFVSSGVCCKWDILVRKGLRSKACLLCNFPNEALHHSSLYGLKSFDQIQSESKVAAIIFFSNALGILGRLFLHHFLDLQVFGWTPLNPLQFSVKLLISPNFLDCELSLAGFLPSVFKDPDNFLMPEILGKFLFLSCVCSLKHFGVAFGDRLLDKKGAVMNWKTFCHWKRLDPRSPAPYWFNVTSRFLLDRSLVPPAAFAFVHDGLLKVWSGSFNVYTDNSLKFAGSSSVISKTTVYFLVLNSEVGIDICGLLSSTLSELQAVALALECIPSSCTVVLHLDSQAAIDTCVSKLAFSVLNFYNHCWIERKYIANLIKNKDLAVSWVKVKSYFGVPGNNRADTLADKTAGSPFSLPAGVCKCFLVAEDTAILGNTCHFVRDVYRSICCAYWETGPSHDVVSVASLQSFDWIASTQVWHPNLHMLAGFTSCKFAILCTYLIKALHRRLPVACLLCGEMELPDHIFTCLWDVYIQEDILLEVSACWISLAGACNPSFSSVLKTLDLCYLDVNLYSVMCKKFVLKDWCAEAVGIFGDVKSITSMVVDFVRYLVKLH